MTDTESAFIEEPLLDGEITGLHLLHESSGGFCQVYLAEKYRQFIVLKCLKPDLRGDPVYEALLRKEFETGYGLNHPALCRTLALTEHPSLGTCIEMEWVDGVTLRQRFSTHKPDEALFRKIAGELCDAVAYLHSRQIIHRDITPGNILITHNGDNLKLIDFGLADTDTSSVLKMAAGTRRYLAPEVLAGKDADSRTDIWAIGTVLSELTPGHRRVLRKCCDPNPDKRYQHIRELKEALEARQGWGIVILAVLCVLGLAAVLIPRFVHKAAAPAPATVDTVLIQHKDTVFLQPAPAKSPAPSGGSASGTTSSSGSDATPDITSADIEQLFQEATGLFE